MTTRAAASVDHDGPAPASYEAPRIEAVLSPEDLEREALYAGPASLT